MSVLEDKVWTALKEIYDPEIPVNIADLGLIYEVQEYPVNQIYIRMTVTSKHCPAAVFLPERAREAALSVTGVKDVEVELAFDPPWTKDRMSEEAKKILGYT